jgi:O-antigen ligase/tetratricopeptide (TPR) repeat protein
MPWRPTLLSENRRKVLSPASVYGQMRWLDGIVTAGIAGLLVLTPLSFGSVYPWAFGPMEAVIFLLGVVWMIKLWSVEAAGRRIYHHRWIIVTGGAFLVLALLQIVPLPPALMRIISPSTYLLYHRTLPGWPETDPYERISFSTNVMAGALAPPKSMILPRVDAVHNGVAVPFAPPTVAAMGAVIPGATPVAAKSTSAELAHSDLCRGGRSVWRTLSVAPGLSYPAMLKALAYSALFLIVVCYPFDPEDRFYRVVLATVILAGVVVAFLGLAEQATWNGKILWFFVPKDRGALDFGAARARGPFVNPDHFADYLAMGLPLTLAVALFPTPLSAAHKIGAYRIMCATTALVILSAIMLSQSRGGWAGAAVAVAVLSALVWARRKLTRPHNSSSRKGSSQRDVVLSSEKPLFGYLLGPLPALVAVAASLLMGLFVIGPAGRLATGARVQDTASNLHNLLFLRYSAWNASVRMTRDFPLFGVGLGAWPELFPRYQSGPWWSQFMREAHDDYMQLLAETGLLGFCAFVALLVSVGRQVGSGFTRVNRIRAPVVAAMLGGIAAIGVHEFVDFSFRIPANAVLFTVLLALVVRTSAGEGSAPALDEQVRAANRPWSLCAAVIFLVLSVGAILQRARAYPDDIPALIRPSEARDLVLHHPARSAVHMSLALMLSDPNQRLKELATAVWLDPVNPHPRDTYARYLTRAGNPGETAKQIVLSVFNSPGWDSHFYLNQSFIPWLSQDEREAVESGFKRAITQDYPGAVGALGHFYDTLGRFSEEAELYSQAAAKERNASARAAYLVAGGDAYAHAGERDKAESMLLRAQRTDPANSGAYESLVRLVYGPQKKLADAESVVRRGLNYGVDPALLYDSLAAAANHAGDPAMAEKALVTAANDEPTVNNLLQLGSWYIWTLHFDLAVATLRKAAQLYPESAAAYHLLAEAEERSYDYAAAERDYGQAAALDPANPIFKQEYVAFRQRMDVGS